MGEPSAISVIFQPSMSALTEPVLAIWTYSSASEVGTTPSKKMHVMCTFTMAATGVGVGRGVGIGVAVGVGGMTVGVAVGLSGTTVLGGNSGVVVGVTVATPDVGV